MDNELHPAMREPNNTADAPAGYARFRTRAGALVRSPDEIRALAMRAAQKLASTSNLKVDSVRGELTSLIELLKAYAGGSYRDVSTRTLVAIAAAVLYFVVPLDLVPDFILGVGYLDDLTVLGYVLGLVRGEVDKFVAWQRHQEAVSE